MELEAGSWQLEAEARHINHGHGNTVGKNSAGDPGKSSGWRQAVRVSGIGPGALGADGRGATWLGVTSLLMLIALIGGLTWYAMSPDWRTLYTNLDSDDARQIGRL